MTDPHGTPIWYELLTPDPDASKAFYDAVIGWTVEAQPSGPIDYRMIDSGADGLVGGMMRLSDDMGAGGAKPRWLFYIGVDDVDATAAAIAAAGGQVHMGPFDLEGVGRMAFVADPQGNPFYIMRGASGDTSTAWDRTGLGKCNWNELATTDQAAGNAFYADVFGWTYPDSMPMGEMGDYIFVVAAGETIGATMTAMPGMPAGWQFYFRTPDIDTAKATVEARGGTVHAGPMEVPGGDRIIVASDPHGVRFGVVAPESRSPDMTGIAPCLWFDGEAEAAATFYASVFPDSAVTAVHRAPGDYPAGSEGDVLLVEFTVCGMPFVGLNAGPQFSFDEAVSFQVYTDSQEETDRYWNAIVGNDGQEGACSWCKDRWGLSWQIVPRVMMAAIASPDRAAAKRAFDAMSAMRKIDHAAIEAAVRGDDA